MALYSTKPYRFRISIPAGLLAGMLFFCICAPAQQLELTRALFAQGDFEQCRCEAKRALLSQTEPREHFELLHALAGAQLNQPAGQTIAALQHLVEQNRNPQTSALAAYELGRQLWTQNRAEEALTSFTFSFHTTTNKSLFLHAACSSFLLMQENKELKKGRADLIAQINTSRSQWYGRLFSECARPAPDSGSEKKLNWIVSVYRAQISPAIGNRCTLEPSCSEYFNQAWHQHGPLALPMIGDRLCREPGINNRQENPVLKSGQIRYADPITNHDFWMNHEN